MKKLKRGYYYLFYRFYKMSEAAPSRWLSDWKATVAITVLELFAIYSGVNYYNIYIDKHFEPTRTSYIVVAIVIVAVNYYYFIFLDIWKEYITEFEKLPKKTNVIGSWIVFGIVAIITANLVFSFYLMSQIDWSLYR